MNMPLQPLVIALLVGLSGCQSTPNGELGRQEKPSPKTMTIDTSACDGRPVTIDEIKWENGNVKRRREVVVTEDGRTVFNGTQSTFYEGGQPKMTMTYVCGVPHGERTSWYPDGSVWSKGAYFNGKDHGTWTVWYTSGQKLQEYTLEYGVWNGTHTRWHENGQESMKVHYVGGMRQGWLVEWNEDGNVTKQVEYADGRIQPTPRL